MEILNFNADTHAVRLGNFPGAWPSGNELRTNQKVPVQLPLGSRLGLGTQPHYEDPGDLRTEKLGKNAVINFR